MREKICIALFAFCCCCCNSSKKEPADGTPGPSANTTTTPPAPTTSQEANTGANGTPYGIMTDPGFLGEWVQQSAVMDANNNGVLDDEERNGKTMHLGFDYFQFNQDLSCLRDHDMKFKGTWEISNSSGKNKLLVRSDPPGEKYTYTLAYYTAKELQLFTDGAFIVFKRP